MQSYSRGPGGRADDRLIASAVFCLLVWLGAGCSSQRQTAETAGNVSPRRSAGFVSGGGAGVGNLVDTNAIQRSPAYREAILCFSGKNYRGALSQVDTLLKTPNLSPSAQTFLRHQQALCLDAISGRPIVAQTTASQSSRSALPRPVRRSASNSDCGPRALLIASEEMHVPKAKEDLPALRVVAGTTADGTSMAGLTKAAQSIGIVAEGVQMDQNALSNLSKPAIAWVDGNHYIAVLAVHHSLMDPSVNGDTATVHDPNKQGKEEMPLGGPTGLLARSGGMLLVLSQEPADKSKARSHG